MKKLFLLSLAMLCFVYYYSFSALTGDGTAGNPWIIDEVSDLEEIMANTTDPGDNNFWNDYMELRTDLNLTGATVSPIGNEVTYFTGCFIGKGYTISNIDYNMTATDYVGFFGYIDGSANIGFEGVISNLNLENVNADGKQKVGSFAGYCKGGRISGCTSSGNASAEEWYVGSFIGVTENSRLTNCTANGNATGVSHIGGFIGDNQSSSIYCCSATGNAVSFPAGDPDNDEWYVGGFVGWNNESIISNCSASGSATGKYDVGAFAGFNGESTITNSTASGNATGIFRVGGFTGNNYSVNNFFNSIIRNCSSSGTASGTGSLGGFVGQNIYGTIEYCSANGNANSLVDITSWSDIGGFAGWNSGGIIKQCYSTGNASCNTTASVVCAVGGFVGINEGANIENCFSTGNARDNVNNTYNYIGGFAGYDYNSITEYCFSYGNVSSANNATLGGFIGYFDSGNYSCCFWNGSANPVLFDSGNIYDLGDEVTPLTESEFSNQSSFACFDFDNTWIMAGGKPVLTALTIPTLTEWAVILFIGLLAGVGSWFVWKRLA